MKPERALKIAAPLRAHPVDVAAGTPLVSLVWRARREEHIRLSEQRAREATERNRLLGALVAAAETAFQSLRSGERKAAEALASELAKAGIEIIAPEGEPYEGLYTELLDNSAQRYETSAGSPRVAEVLAPAVVYRGAVLKRGKAVIALPASESPERDGVPEGA